MTSALSLLARADSSDPSASNLQLVFLSLLILAGTAFLGFLIVRAARLRAPRHVEVFAAFAVLWVALTAGTAIYDLTIQLNWSKESTARIQSGYFDPAQVETDAPGHPSALYIAAVAGYCALWLIVSRSRLNHASP
ncbi:MAG TPA: hypothetical protein VIM11_05950 [Tepidisphaeraceae bacterium]|jgi:hypothetical protein